MGGIMSTTTRQPKEKNKVLLWIMTGLAGLLMFSTVVCGLWIRSQGSAAGQSDVNFHMGIGLATVAVTAVALALGAI
jgi:hypothetical protein